MIKRSTDHCHINDLAYRFAQTNDQWAFSQLYKEVRPLILIRAEKAYQRAQRKGVCIPIEDFISFFNQGLFQASKGYDIKLGDFLSRYYTNLRLREADVWRCYETRGKIENERKYEKARLLSFSLDKSVSEVSGETVVTLLDLVPCPSAEDCYFERELPKNLILEFSQMNNRYASIVLLLDRGYQLQEIASLMGESSYNAKMRKLVQRTRTKFGKFLKSRIM